MTDLFDQEEGATPLEPEEREGLKVPWVTFRRDLNKVEHDNIAKAIVQSRGRSGIDPLNDRDLCRLHKLMFGEVWTWAGTFRSTVKNIGIEAPGIPVALRQLCDDVRYWIDNDTFERDEIATRFHHGLVFIHPFPNGNGRWARLAADLLVSHLGGESFSWGRALLEQPGEARRAYIAALRDADNQHFQPIIVFARS